MPDTINILNKEKIKNIYILQKLLCNMHTELGYSFFFFQPLLRLLVQHARGTELD